MNRVQLVKTKDVFHAAGLEKLGILGMPLAWSVKSLTGLSKANKIYGQAFSKNQTEFLQFVLDTLQVDFEVHEEDLKRIPKSGPFVVVANHPLGAMDGILMMHILTQVRPDFKIMGNFLLQHIKPIEEMVIAVNPFESRKEAFNSNKGIKAALKHIENGACLGIFPAGEVSSRTREGGIDDREWQRSVIKMIKKMQVPVIPMYFHCKNSELFYRLAKLHPAIQTALLPKEAVRTRSNPVHIRIGKSITVKQQQDFPSIEELSAYLRKKTYSLSTYYSKKEKLVAKLKIPSVIHTNSLSRKPKAIIKETPAETIAEEILQLKKSGNKLFTSSNYECYFAKAGEIPAVLREIGRLREVTFREIGEGTNQETDLDHYDAHYRHLFLWDNERQKLAGAYRIALGKKIYEKYGVQGFYLHELFQFEPEFRPFFSQCIEMGRAFVAAEYQQKPLPLFLLWRGVVHVTLRHPSHKYIIGSVSISNRFSDFSKSLMVEFMKSNYYDPYIAQFIRAKNDFKIRLKEEDKTFFFNAAAADLNKLDKLIDELEPNMLRLPVLIKKYIKQNAKVIGFNVDPKFNDAIDGLMYIRICDLPEDTVKPVLEELQTEMMERIDFEKEISVFAV